MALRDLLPEDPRVLGTYRLTGRLGAGGMGVVYLGFDDAGGAVAVKTLRPGADEDARTRMRREAEHMGAVSTARVAPLLASDTAAEPPWIASAYVAGESLAEAAVPLADGALRALASGLAEALAALNEAGITHRDVKPGNIILRHDGPVLVDLGIARGDDATALTQAGLTLGSPGWMSPEQLRGEPVGPPADVWGWGAVLAYAATGRPPFGDGPVEAVGWRVLGAEPDLAGVPGWLDPAVRAALSKDPAERPVAPVLAQGPAPGSVPVGPASPPTAELPLPGKPGRRHHAAWLWAAGVVALVVFGVMAAVRLNGDPDRPAAQPGTSASTTSTQPSAPVSQVTPSRSPTLTPTRSPSPSPTGASSSASAPSTSPTPVRPTTTPPPRSLWPTAGPVVRVGNAPPFPAAIPGYRNTGGAPRTETLRGPGWHAITGIAPLASCGDYLLLVRWQSVSGAVVQPGVVDAASRRLVTFAPGGQTGWTTTDGCQRAAFSARTDPRIGDQFDVAVDVQVWRRI